MNKVIPVITCEHAGNEIPAEFQNIFNEQVNIIHTHRALDFGALELAETISGKLGAPLYFTKTSRLVVEANRSLGEKDLFSEYTNVLSAEEKENVINTYYSPYRVKVEEEIKKMIEERPVIHISVHTFTPILNSETRRADIGLLYDPGRKNEAKFCKLLEREIINADYKLIIKHNYPYKGTDDGFTTFLRNKFPEDKYLGIEIEVNQKYPLMQQEKWNALKENISTAINYAALKF